MSSTRKVASASLRRVTSKRTGMASGSAPPAPPLAPSPLSEVEHPMASTQETKAREPNTANRSSFDITATSIASRRRCNANFLESVSFARHRRNVLEGRSRRTLAPPMKCPGQALPRGRARASERRAPPGMPSGFAPHWLFQANSEELGRGHKTRGAASEEAALKERAVDRGFIAPGS